MNYTMSQVTTLTGIKGHTLRVWERRYNFLLAERKKSGIRYYSEEQVKILLNVSVLLKSGVKISTIAKMTAEEILAKSLEVYDVENENHEIQIQFFINTMMSYDAGQFHKKFNYLENNMGLLDLMISIIYPLLRRIGGLWTGDKSIPAQEHFISNLIRQKLIAAIDQLGYIYNGKNSIILFLPAGDDHELGLLLANYLLKKSGWTVIYLGTRLPIQDLENVIANSNSQHAFTMLRFVNQDIVDELLVLVNAKKDFQLFINGNSDLLDPLIDHMNVTLLNSPKDILSINIPK